MLHTWLETYKRILHIVPTRRESMTGFISFNPRWRRQWKSASPLLFSRQDLARRALRARTLLLSMYMQSSRVVTSTIWIPRSRSKGRMKTCTGGSENNVRNACAKATETLNRTRSTVDKLTHVNCNGSNPNTWLNMHDPFRTKCQIRLLCWLLFQLIVGILCFNVNNTLESHITKT